MNISSKANNLFFSCVQFATCTVFLGRAWQHWRWDAPYRALFWDEERMSGIVISLFGMDWETYITSLQVDNYIQSGIKAIGIYYFCCALIALFIKKLPSIFNFFLLLGGISLMILAALYCKERFFSMGQFFEYTLQFGSPLLLFYLRYKPNVTPTLLLVVKIGIALAFTAHGLYALGFYPRPVNFMEMTMNILGVGEESAIQFLTIAGILDFVISFGIFLPWKWAKYCLLYAVLWGGATTLARIVANFNWEWLNYVFIQWLHESVMRFPHFLIPLAVLGFYYYSKKKTI